MSYRQRLTTKIEELLREILKDRKWHDKEDVVAIIQEQFPDRRGGWGSEVSTFAIHTIFKAMGGEGRTTGVDPEFIDHGLLLPGWQTATITKYRLPARRRVARA